MRITIISDTHGRHAQLGRLSGDVLIHCGDVEDLFNRSETALDAVDAWFGAQDFELILCIGGNHDRALEHRARHCAEPFRNATWLHERTLTHRGVTFHGASWVPELPGHAFHADDARLKAALAAIPDRVDVLVTHTPPAGILDVSSRGGGAWLSSAGPAARRALATAARLRTCPRQRRAVPARSHDLCQRLLGDRQEPDAPPAGHDRPGLWTVSRGPRRSCGAPCPFRPLGA